MTTPPSSAATAKGALAVALAAFLVSLAGWISMPPLDRDESRFVQATAQMLETGDFVNIRFQDQARNKKPAGIHWMQAASVSAVSDVAAREVWAYRIPSMAGAVIAALFTYLAGAKLYNAQTGLLAGLMIAAAPSIAGEATIAKTDAMLLASVAVAQTAFLHIYAAALSGARARRVWVWLLWIALGVGILLKGPIAPMITGLTGVALLFRKRRIDWIKAIKPVTGALILTAMVAPWAIMIGIETSGRFYTEALGGDMLGKVGSVQESHSGPPGYHLALVWILLWPAAALLVPGVATALSSRKSWPTFFLLAWIIPSWIVFELTATKLPHYTMPLYPALAILASRAAAIGAASRKALWRRAGAAVYAAIGLGVAVAIVILPRFFGEGALATYCFIGAILVAAASLMIGAMFWRGESYRGGLAASALSAFVAFMLLEAVLPALDDLRLSPRASQALVEIGAHPLRDNAPPAVLAGYYEPSAVFLMGTDTVLTQGAAAAQHLIDHPRAAAIVADAENETFLNAARDLKMTVERHRVIEGFNYSKGDPITLFVYSSALSEPAP